MDIAFFMRYAVHKGMVDQQTAKMLTQQLSNFRQVQQALISQGHAPEHVIAVYKEALQEFSRRQQAQGSAMKTQVSENLGTYEDSEIGKLNAQFQQTQNGSNQATKDVPGDEIDIDDELEMEPLTPDEYFDGGSTVALNDLLMQREEMAQQYLIEDHLEIIERLGEGGMGEVHLARMKTTRGLVALKINKSDEHVIRKLFVNETLVTARLMTHPNIPPFFAMGCNAKGQLCSVMGWIKGDNLQKLIRSKRLSTEEKIQIAVEICETLQFAHEANIVNRDLKPENVMIGSHGEVRVIDWGLATKVGAPSVTDEFGEDLNLERDEDGTMLKDSFAGTLVYMAPEQVTEDATIDARTDIFLIGAIVYEMFAGHAPYRPGKNEDQPQLMLRVSECRGVKPLEVCVPGISPELVAIVNRAMAREKRHRYPSSAQMSEDLKRLQAGMMLSPSTYTYSQKEKVVRWIAQHPVRSAVAALGSLAFLLIVSVILWYSSAASQAEARYARKQATLEKSAREQAEKAKRAQEKVAKFEKQRRQKREAELRKALKRQAAIKLYVKAVDWVNRRTNIKEAIDLLDLVIARVPDMPEAHIARGDAKRLQPSMTEPADIKGAVKDYLKANELLGGSSRALAKAGLAYIFCAGVPKADRDRLGLPYLDKAARKGNDAYALLGKVFSALRRNNSDEVLRIAGNVPRELDKLWEYHLALGIFYAQRRMYKKAEYHYDQALKGNPRSHNTWVNLGVLYRRQAESLRSQDAIVQMYLQALSAINTAIRLQPGYGKAYECAGTIYVKLSQPNSAILYYSKAISLGYLPALYQRLALYGQMKQWKGVVNDASVLIKKYPNNANLYLQRADAFRHMKYYKQAKKDYKKALSLNPNSPKAQAIRNMIRLLESKGF